MIERDQLPQDLQQLMHGLESDTWRERKEATASLTAYLSSEACSDETRSDAIDVLMDEVIAPATLGSRAASQELLSSLGSANAALVLQRVRSESASAARMLVDILAQIGTAAEVDGLADVALDVDADANLRAAVATVLGTIGGDRAVNVLHTLLDDAQDVVRLFALDALRLTDASVHEEVLATFADDLGTRKSACALLARRPSLRTVQLLARYLDDPVRSIRATVAVSLAQVLHRLEGAGDDAQLVLSAIACEALLGLIAHADPEVAASAIAVSGYAGNWAAISVAIENSEHAEVFERAVWLVERAGKEASSVLEQVAENLERPEYLEIWLRLVSCVRPEYCSTQLGEKLAAMLDHSDTFVRVAAIDALAGLECAGAIPRLFGMLEQAGSLGEHAGDALGRMLNLPRGYEYLQQWLDRSDVSLHGTSSVMARNLCRVLGHVNQEISSQLLSNFAKSPDASVRGAAVHAFGHLPEDEIGRETLCVALTDEHAPVRSAACRSLAQRRESVAVPMIRAAALDSEAGVRVAAISALVELDSFANLDLFRAAIQEDQSPTVVMHAITGLGAAGASEDLHSLITLTENPDIEIAKAAMGALVRQRSHRSTAALIGLLSHPHWDIRWSAAQYLEKKGDMTALSSLRLARESEEDSLVAEALDRAVSSFLVVEEGAA